MHLTPLLRAGEYVDQTRQSDSRKEVMMKSISTRVSAGIGSVVWTVLLIATSLSTSAGESPTLAVGRGKYPIRGKLMRPPLPREVVREALILAALEQGWGVVDCTMLDVEKANVEERFEQEYQYSKKDKCVFRVTISDKDQKHTVIHEAIRTGSHAENYEAVVRRFEALSRSKFAGLFEPVERRDVQFPRLGEEELQDLRGNFNVLSQFRLVRQAHAAVALDGATPARLQLLSEGYANLGLLSYPIWSLAPKAFFARSLLYARRVEALYPESPEATLAPLYAWTAFGTPKTARRYLTVAEALPAADQPFWAASVDAFLHRDWDSLLAIVEAGGRDAPLAGHLGTSMTWCQGAPLKLHEIGFAAMKANPADIVIGLALSDRLGVSPQHRTTTHCLRAVDKVIKNRLGSMPDIDAMVRKTRADSEPEAETGAVAELSKLFGLSRENGGETTLRQIFEGLASHRSESVMNGAPAPAALGRILEGLYFQAANRRLRFWDRNLGVKTHGRSRPFVDTLVAHPYRSMLGAFDDAVGISPIAPELTLQEVTGEMFAHITLHFGINDVGRFKNMNYGRFFYLGQNAFDFNVRDVELQDYRQRRRKRDFDHYANWLRDIDPENPLWLYSLVQSGHLDADKAMRKHRDMIDRSRALQAHIGYQLHTEGKGEQAVELLTQALQGKKSAKLLEQLAYAHWSVGNAEGWRNAMEQCLELPDTGLRHASICLKMARHFARTGQWELAEEYGERSARSYAEWGLTTAMLFNAVNGDWEQSYRYAVAAGGRYGTLSLAYHAVLKDAPLDAPDAGRLVQWVKDDKDDGISREITLAGVDYALGAPQKALQRLEKVFAPGNTYALWQMITLLLEKKHGDPERAQTMLAEFIDVTRKRLERKPKSVHDTTKACLELAVAWQDCLTKADDEASVERLVATVEETEKTFGKRRRAVDLRFIMGQMLEGVGRDETAFRLYRDALKVYTSGRTAELLVYKRLRELGHNPIELLKDRVAKRELWPDW